MLFIFIFLYKINVIIKISKMKEQEKFLVKVFTMNNCSFIGRLTQDPEIKISQSGMEICNFTIAVKKQTKDKEANFINCTAFKNSAKYLGDYVKKGSLVSVEGSLDINIVEDPNDSSKRKQYVKILVRQVEKLSDPKNQSEQNNQQPNYQQPNYQQPNSPQNQPQYNQQNYNQTQQNNQRQTQQNSFGSEFPEDEIPF